MRAMVESKRVRKTSTKSTRCKKPVIKHSKQSNKTCKQTKQQNMHVFLTKFDIMRRMKTRSEGELDGVFGSVNVNCHRGNDQFDKS